MIFDTHVHYDEARFDADRDEVLAGLRERGVSGAVNVGANLRSCEAGQRLAAQYPFLRFSAGVHPDDVAELEALGEEEALESLRRFLADPKAVAVGEIGLDYYGDYPDKTAPALQQKWFSLQLDLAKDCGKPVIIHSRDAAADTLSLIKAAGGKDIPMVIHCFSYEKEMAREYLNMGHFLGVGGVVTYKNGRKLKDVVNYMPIDRLLLETDGPYLAPVPLRGTRNDSGNLKLVAEEIARIKGISPEEVEAVSFDNALRFYRLKAEAFL